MRRFSRILFRLILLLGILFVIFIGAMWAREWQPEAIEVRQSAELSAGTADSLTIGDTLKVVSWNIGYAGLGDDMDFFYDGGKSMRTTQERTRENLDAIISFLRRHSDADFILLQEVDFDSKRSYRMNQYDSIREALPGYMGWWGLNYVADFVPLPVTHPMGRVKSGIVILSRWEPVEVIRYQYPGGYGFPMRLFNLKRALLSASFKLQNGGTLYINNTHNTAYDSGDMREQELDFLRNFLGGKPFSATLGDWNCNPPGYQASAAALQDKHFSPLTLERADFPLDMSFVYDPTTPSLRYGYESYRPGETTTTVTDFALCGSGIEPVAFETVDLGFHNSDHNPVVMKFVVRDFGAE